uniref:Uncharacterized protein n=1 Tax=Rhizophora mucronata TaxID=61149 RepID=A0A2P2QXQ4_RHIMU
MTKSMNFSNPLNLSKHNTPQSMTTAVPCTNKLAINSNCCTIYNNT